MSYDLAGRLLNINTPTDPGDPTTGDYGFDFDTAGRMIEQSMPDSKTVGYELDDNGNRIKLIYPDGYYAEYFYDELDRLTDINLNGATTAAIHFDYDDLSRRTMVTYENGCTCSYSWDLNDDIASLKHEFDNDSVDFAFSYNKVHQTTAMSVSNSDFVWTPSASKTTIYSTANNLNQYPGVGGTSYSYNNNGCLTGGLLTSASFDELNRLTQAVRAGITNDYWNDPLNRQGQKAIDSVKTGFLYDEQQLIEEYDDNGDLAYRYIRGNKLDEIFIRIAGATKTYFHHDRLGSIIATSNDSGVVQTRNVYSPFGETSSLSGTPFGFTGQRYDGEMGLYYYRARIYSPAIGRFLQPDPLGFDAGDLNLYGYVGNNPISFVDPLGLDGTVNIYKVPGHTIVEVIDSSGKSNAVGFYPMPDPTKPSSPKGLQKLDALFQNEPGMIIPEDVKGLTPASTTENIPDADIKRALDYIAAERERADAKKKNYNLFSQCESFAGDVQNQAVKNLAPWHKPGLRNLR